jgi:hypothetical protein
MAKPQTPIFNPHARRGRRLAGAVACNPDPLRNEGEHELNLPNDPVAAKVDF